MKRSKRCQSFTASSVFCFFCNCSTKAPRCTQVRKCHETGKMCQNHPVVSRRGLTRVYLQALVSSSVSVAFCKCNVCFAQKIKQKLPSFSKRDWWWSCESEWMSARSASAICLSLCFTRGVPTGHVWWIGYSIRGALLGRPHQCSELMMLWLPWSAFLCPTIVYYILLQR